MFKDSAHKIYTNIKTKVKVRKLPQAEKIKQQDLIPQLFRPLC